MDLDNFIIGQTKERRGEIWQKKQQLLSKHRAAVDGKNSQKTEERGAFDEHHPHLMKRHVEQFQIHRETQLHKLITKKLATFKCHRRIDIAGSV